jgi:hypothetical protein
LTDWLELCRAAVADVDAVLERMPTRAEREPVVGSGEGGDETTAIDQAAEEAILARIEDVWEVARRGDVMPQKSTFFYPKLTSGLLMLPLGVGSTEPTRSERAGSAGAGSGN